MVRILKRIPPDRWRAPLTAAILGSLALGLADPLLRSAALVLGSFKHLGSWLSVCALLPGLIGWTAAAYPRYAFAVLAVVGSTVAYIVGVVGGHSIACVLWTPASMQSYASGGVLPLPAGELFMRVSAVMAVVLLPYVGMSMLAIRIRRNYCVVGGPDPLTCTHCGYSLIGLPEPRCPECGQPFQSPPN